MQDHADLSRTAHAGAAVFSRRRLLGFLVAAMILMGAEGPGSARVQSTVFAEPSACPPPGSPSSFWGYVTLNGTSAPLGLKVEAWINGIQVATTTTGASSRGTYYLLDVPDRATDPATGRVCRQGGATGEPVSFALCDAIVSDQQGAWNVGSLVRLDFNAAGDCGATPPIPASPAVGIVLADQKVELTWPHITRDSAGNPLAVARYDVWRNVAPYFTASGETYTSVVPSASAQAGDPIIFTEGSAAAANTSYAYVVKAISVIGRPSTASNRTASFTYGLVAGGP